MNQQTIRERIELVDREFYGGNYVKLTLSPADENTGIFFANKRGKVKARLDCAVPSKYSIMLQNEDARFLNVEHLLATLYVYGIDNARIEVERLPSLSFKILNWFGLATDIEVIPALPKLQRTLCERIEDVGLTEQNCKRRRLRLKEEIGNEKLMLSPVDHEGLTIRATTEYAPVGKESVKLVVGPREYKRISSARACVKQFNPGTPRFIMNILAMVAYPNFGIGHGFTERNVFIPPKTRVEWRQQEFCYFGKRGEIGYHTIIDRIGALALLGYSLSGVHVECKFSGHKNDLRVLRENEKMFYFEE
ncbi:UDP-3-O-acyl-N-acetylglucosamine deacetylase [Candidatus Pacearchaeota archaeon]|nr:UDP-3-O-acyl-N-acetylglucosamine deacetylase [Candidatus Pacearchaeota archaeon]